MSTRLERLFAPARGSDSPRELGSDALRVARYLRGLRAHRARARDVYISSYPRSGTTWMQLLVHLVQGGDTSFSHIADAVPWFERSLSLGRATAADFARRADPRAFKSHLPHAWLPRGGRYLYVYRDGRDVAVSYYHFYRSHLGLQDGFEEFFERFLRGDLQYGSWFRHVADWRRLAGRPDVRLVAYEELARDPERVLDTIAELCAARLTPRRKQEILGLASFDAMKRLEHKFDHAAAEPVSRVHGGQFVREGRVGGHRELLSSSQHERFARRLAREEAHFVRELRLWAFLR